MPAGLVRIIATVDAAICFAAYAASKAAPGSITQKITASVVVGGMGVGILEKLPKFLARRFPGPDAASAAS